MKYLLLASIAAMLSTCGHAQQSDDMFAGVSFNEDVNRKVNLDASGVVDISTDLKFKPVGNNEPYYFVIPQGFEEHIVSISAVASSTQVEAKVERVTKVPNEIQRVINNKNASDIVIFKIDTQGALQSGKGVYALTIREIYKRRKEPFPS